VDAEPGLITIMANIWPKIPGVFISPKEMPDMQSLDDLDRQILDILQSDFPLSTCPYMEISKRLMIREEELLERIIKMKNSGLIRRIGGIMDSWKLGFYSTLCAASVPEEKIKETAEVINKLPGVSHNYLRDNDLNMWFTLTMPSKEEAAKSLQELETLLGISIINMPARKIFKIKVCFDMGSSNEL
jgi:DNA-binding Lrp family transcriptional regulator